MIIRSVSIASDDERAPRASSSSTKSSGALMPGLAARARCASLSTESSRCYVCTTYTEPGKDLVVSVGLKRYPVHRDHLSEADVQRLLAKAAA